MSEQIMNTGWHRGGFEPPVLRNSMPIWPDLLDRSYRVLYNFDWLGGGRLLRFEQQPFVQRQVGMPEFGGTYEHCLLRFDPADASDMPERLISLGSSNGAAPLEPEGMNVTVRSGVYSDEGKHWVELYNPYAFKRERMSLQEFAHFTGEVDAHATNVLTTAKADAEAKLASGSKADELRYQHIAQFDQRHLISQALVLASFFSDRRIPLATLMQLLLGLPNFKITYACVKDLPADGGAGEIPLRRLLLLYSDAA